MNIPERIAALRTFMEKQGFDVYLVPTDDFHQSEYVADHFKSREFLTGFTGSAGTAIITQTEAGLWTDGRYFIQAEKQLEKTGITLYKAGLPGFPMPDDYIQSVIPHCGTLGFDGRVVSMRQGESLEALLSSKNAKINYSKDLIDGIWEDRPALPDRPVFRLDEKYTGENTAKKLSRIRKVMQESGANVHIVASLDDICWITNLRGSDIRYSPLMLAYAVITMDHMNLYIDRSKIAPDIKQALSECNISLHPYEAIYEDVKNFGENSRILIDPSRINYALYKNLPREAVIIKQTNPAVFMKAVKNEVEIKNIINAHIKDGIAVTRFMYWLKKNIGKSEITEISAAKKLECFRREQPGYLWQSFEPICASGEHGAIVHYSATPETNIPVTTDGLFLTDTGGGYLEGSTDITRTFAFGSLTERMKKDFTTVLLCNLRLARAVFPYGTCGYNLDVLARMPVWERGMNYNHGTGHGVGYLLNIHEAPCRFHTSCTNGAEDVLEPGMILTDEPGIYIEGAYGIRTENELLIREGTKNEYGRFLYFEPVTCVPIDLDAIDSTMLDAKDREQLNAYHANVYDTIAPHLCGDEQKWLKKYTRAI